MLSVQLARSSLLATNLLVADVQRSALSKEDRSLTN